MKILMLEDNRNRIAAFKASLLDLPNTNLIVWRSAHTMLKEFPGQLVGTSLISLDHDLIEDEGDPDPGDGVMIAEALAKHKPVCPVIVHSTNINRVYSMLRELDDGGWATIRVAPIGMGEDWIPTVWLPCAKDALGLTSTFK